METSSLIPGFRFHPTDHELVMYYLKRKLTGKKILVNAVSEVNIYEFSPWDLPDKSSLKSGDLEWFFFCPKSRKYTSGARLNRSTENGFWKATGKDRKIEYRGRNVATIKTLVFHLGHALKGERTNWVMHEYNMNDQKLADEGIVQDMYVLCKIFEKEGVGPKNGAQYGAPFKEEEWDVNDDVATSSGTASELVLNSHGPTNKPDDNQMGPITPSLTEPESSTVTFSENETENCKQKSPETSAVVSYSADVAGVGTPVNDDVMFFEDLAFIFEGSNEGINGNNINKGVEVDKMKEVGPNKEDDIYGDLMKLVDLDDFITSEPNKFGAEYTLDMIMGADDLDADLGRFWVD